MSDIPAREDVRPEAFTPRVVDKFRVRYRSLPLALLVLCLLVFGPLVFWLGFYWDDWPTVWYQHVLGPAGFQQVFAIDRPLLGAIFAFTTTLLGASPLAWQIFAILTRWGSAVALWWVLHTLWPRHRLQTAWVVLLFAVYPGFLQQPIAVTYSNAWIVLIAFFLSLGLMIQAVRQRKIVRFWAFSLLSLALAAFAMFSTEYFFGLELLRPIFLWFSSSEESRSKKRRLGKVFQYWLPYLALMGVFLYWRLAIHETARGQVNLFERIEASPLAATGKLLATILRETLTGSLLAWGQVFDIPAHIGVTRIEQALYLVVVLGIMALVSFYLLGLRAHYLKEEKSEQEAGIAWAWQAIGIGLFALLAAGWPFWATNLPIRLVFPWDRFTLAMMLGASLLIVGLLDLLPGGLLWKSAAVAIAIGLAAGFHLQQANLYRKEWNYQKELFWQLTWRAPALQPGTTLLTASLPFTYFSDNSLAAPLNWTYAPDFHGTEMPYMFYAVESRLGRRIIDFKPGLPIYQPYRATEFSGSTSQALVFYFEPPGCARFVELAVDKEMPQKPDFIEAVLPLSRIDLILPAGEPAAHPPQFILGSEPEHNWCYYFEKADLARQQDDWQTVARLGDQAFASKPTLYPVNAPELITFIEGYARSGQFGRAAELTRQAHRLTFRMDRMLCANWKRIEPELALSPANLDSLNELKKDLASQP